MNKNHNFEFGEEGNPHEYICFKKEEFVELLDEFMENGEVELFGESKMIKTDDSYINDYVKSSGSKKRINICITEEGTNISLSVQGVTYEQAIIMFVSTSLCEATVISMFASFDDLFHFMDRFSEEEHKWYIEHETELEFYQ